VKLNPILAGWSAQPRALIAAGGASYQVSPIPCQLGPGLATEPPPMIVLPFMSQTETWPLLVFCIRISEPPPPVPTACQLGPGSATGPPPIMLLPLISQTE